MFRLCRARLETSWTSIPSSFFLPKRQRGAIKGYDSSTSKWQARPRIVEEPKPSLAAGQRRETSGAQRSVTPNPRRPESARSPEIGTSFLLDDQLTSPQFLQRYATKWTQLPFVQNRFMSYGISPDGVRGLLRQFALAASSGNIGDDPVLFQRYNVVRLDLRSIPPDAESTSRPSDIALSNIFLLWVVDPANKSRLDSKVDPQTVEKVRDLVAATNIPPPPDWFPKTRRMKRRFILHIGPTNSGKTHHALRALAAAESGCYAGPLRLLAHEIFERLNLGQICPEGMDPSESSPPEPVAAPNPGASTDTPIVRLGNPAWARDCNMLTGEEVKIVDPEARLTSCTIEMLNLGATYEVAVVDEIQMIADTSRGHAWTTAVLGLAAHEIHLCGEDTVEPIIRELLRQTGDDLEIRRYERLSPLIPTNESLERDWGKVEKGDCIVTFSRKDIFSVKRQVEKATGLRCAVVYGKLPPEIRSEQASLFNDPDSGYDVLVGSDAIGMGLNLKIRRIVFHSVEKFNGRISFPLSVSQLKQIAGRAGRFGLQLNPNEKPGGYVTTFDPSDLRVVHATLPKPNSPVLRARVTPRDAVFTRCAQALPHGTSLATVVDFVMHGVMLPPVYIHSEMQRIDEVIKLLDQADGNQSSGSEMGLSSMASRANAPIAWGDKMTIKIFALIIRQMRTNMQVDLRKTLGVDSYVEYLEKIEQTKEALEESAAPMEAKLTKLLPDYLQLMENLHKILTCYIWLAFRNPVSFPEVDDCQAIKARCEVILEWLLSSISTIRHHSPQDALGSPAPKVKHERMKVLLKPGAKMHHLKSPEWNNRIITATYKERPGQMQAWYGGRKESAWRHSEDADPKKAE